MKKTLILLVLLFSYSIFADDISDLQIEGMGLGDSLLDYFTEQEINNNMMQLYDYIEGNKFISTGFESKLFKTYELMND